jgi:hypothetical protein
MSDFLMFLAHGERPLLQFHDVYDDPDYHEDENKYFKINDSDTNFYLTFSDIGKPLYQLPINIIHYGLSSLKSQEIFTEKLNEISRMSNGTGIKYSSLQILLNGIIINGCIKNLFLLAKNKKKIVEDTLSPYQDWPNIYKNNFLDLPTDISFNFADISPKFENEKINEYYQSIIKFFDIDNFLYMLDFDQDPYKNPIFKMLMFNLLVSDKAARILLCIYKFIIYIICSMMKVSPHNINDLLFFSILKYYPSDEIFINYIINSTNKNIFDLPIFNKLVELIQKDFIIPQNLSLKLYYSGKPIPNYNYFINGYFDDEADKIVKVGLRKFTDYYNLINNKNYNLSSNPDEKYSKKIEPLKKKCLAVEKSYNDKTGRVIISYNSVIDDKDVERYLHENYYFMNNGSLYPVKGTIDDMPKKFTEESGEKRIGFIKGNVRSLKELINKEKIFGENNIVLLFSCAVDLESADEVHHSISRARAISIDYQNQKKYLKYKNKYLQFKKKLGL